MGEAVVALVPVVVSGGAAAAPAVRGAARRVLLGVSARKLADNIVLAARSAKPPGSIAHHIVGAAKKLEPAIAVLKKFGIGLNDAENGVFLKEEIHRRVHSNAYYAAVNEALGAATTREQAIAILKDIGTQLARTGRFP